MTDANTTQIEKLYTKDQVAEWADLSTRKIEMMVKAGEFPQPLRFGNSPRWSAKQLADWVTQNTPVSATGSEIAQ